MEYFFVDGNRYSLDGGAMFGHVPRALWSQWYTPDENNCVPLASHCLVVRHEQRTLLFETGIGHYLAPKYARRFGLEGDVNQLPVNLNKRGVLPGDVTDVILSHLHFDHAGGLMPDWPAREEGSWQPLFPNARYWVGATQFARAQAPHVRDRASYIPDLCDKLKKTGRLHLISPDEPAPPELADILTFHFSDGHTLGLMHALIHGTTPTIFFASDLIPGTRWIHIPINTGYDRCPEKGADEKRAFLEKAVQHRWLVMYPHDPQTAASHVLYNQDRNRFEPDPGA